MNLYSDNLILRSFLLEDAERVSELAGDYEIAKTTLNIPFPYPEGAAEAYIKRSHEVAREGSHYNFAIVSKDKNDLLGAIALGITPKYKRAEMA